MDKVYSDLSSLLRLFETLDREVEGRESLPPPPEVQSLLGDLLGGKISSPEQRKAAFELLRKEPRWLAWFAERIKSQRQSSNAPE